MTRLILQNAAALGEAGIIHIVRRSNGKRLIQLHRADSAVNPAPQNLDPFGTVRPTGAAVCAFPAEAGE